MSFILILLFSVLSGLLGGMGMGGGTILIPALTIFLGVEQHVAQAANLFAFLPMSLLSLRIHSGNGLIRTDGLWSVIVPAVALSALGAVFAALTPSRTLGKLFGAFLIALALKQIADMKVASGKKGG